MIRSYNEKMGSKFDVSPSKSSCSFKFTPVYHRRFFLTSDLDTDSCYSSTKSPRHARNFTKTAQEHYIEKTKNEPLVNVDPFYDIYIPVAESLAMIFRHLYGISPSANLSTTLSEVYDTSTLLQPLGKPKLEERQIAIYQYLNICIGMRQWLESKNVSSSILYYPPFATSYALIDLYYFLWYSNAEDWQKKKRKAESHQIKDKESSSSLQTGKVDVTWIKSKKMFLKEYLREQMESRLFSSPIFLLSWYKMHIVQLSSKHLAEEVMRAMTLFEYDLTAAPVLIKNEMSEHVARLLLLCHFNEFFQCLVIFSNHGEPFARLLHETLVEKVLEKTSTIWTANLENELLHQPFLNRIRETVRNLPTDHNQKTVENFETLKSHSIFGYSFDILYGDVESIDSVIQKVFPKCWLSSFILGWFWKPVKDVERVVQNLLNNTTLESNATGSIVGYFFKSWFKEYEFFQKVDHSKRKDIGIIALLSCDICQFVEFLRKNSDYPCSPVLVDLVSYDHPFKQCTQICKEIFFNQKVKHFVSDSIAASYFFRILLDTRFEILQYPFKNNFSLTQPLTLGDAKRKSRYTLEGINDSVSTASTQAKMPNQFLCENSCQTLEDAMLVFLQNNDQYCQDFCSFLIEKKQNIPWAILGCLFWDLRRSDSYSKIAYQCHLLDAFLTGQSSMFLLWVSSCLLSILKVTASQWFLKETKGWEGFMLILFCITMEFDMEYLKPISSLNGLPYEEKTFSITGHPSLAMHVSSIGKVENEMLFSPKECEYTWREKMHACTANNTPRNADFQTNDFLNSNIQKWIDSFTRKTETKDNTTCFICLPSWCKLPQEYIEEAVSYLFLAHIYCPSLVFYLILNHYLEDYRFVEGLWKNGHLNDLTKENQTRVQRCLYWLLKCLLEKFVPVHEFHCVMRLLRCALKIEIKGKGKVCFFTLKQLQEFQNFMTFYITGMLQDIYTLKEIPPDEDVSQLLMDVQHYKTGCEVICTQLDLQQWKPWIFQHFL